MRVFAASLMLLAGLPAALAQPPGPEWWVVVGSTPAPDNIVPPNAPPDRAAEAARRCGADPFNDFSNKFSGFTPGYNVTVAGGYPTRAQAEAMLARVRPCVPDAFIRRGTYAGD